MKMTCQICARPIEANNGTIAHHGYRRPEGWGQTASCYGARQHPLEESRNALIRYIRVVSDEMTRTLKTIQDVTAEIVPVPLSIRPDISKLPITLQLTRDNFAEMQAAHRRHFLFKNVHTFDGIKQRHLETLNATLAEQTWHRNEQLGRAEEWTQTHEWTPAGWTPLA